METSTQTSLPAIVKAPIPPFWARAGVAVGLAVTALLLALWGLWSAHSATQSLTQNVAVKLAETNGALNRTVTQLDQLGRDLRDAQNRLAQMEGNLAEFQTQRIALEEMYRDLARVPDDWLLAEVEQTLNIASRELILAGNIKAALIALQTVDQRLARADKLQVVVLRRAITQDMDMLKSLPQIDSMGMSLKLDHLISQSATLPLRLPSLNTPLSKEEPASQAEGWLQRMGRELWQELKSLVRVHDLKSGDVVLLSPEQGYFVRESLKLRLLSARNDLLARDEAHYKDNLRRAHDLLATYFDPKAKVNINAMATLRQLADGPVSIATPDLTASLNAVRAARAARERSAR